MKSLIFLLILLSSSCLAVDKKQQVDVIAVDYPPYTSPESPNDGSNFSLLREYADLHFRVSIKPHFLPPARAHRYINSDDWCLSFYPPAKDNKLVRFIALSEKDVSIGFYRLKQSQDFRWNTLGELKGKTIALLRANSKGKMHQTFIDAGLVLVHVESIEQGLQLVIMKRVDYAFGDNLSLSGNSLTVEERQSLQFSETKVHVAKIGFYYNIQCETLLFTTAE